MGSTHRLLLLGLILVGTCSLNRSVEVAILELVLLHLSLGVEPFIALNDVVVCREGGLKATKEDVVLLELVSFN